MMNRETGVWLFQMPGTSSFHESTTALLNPHDPLGITDTLPLDILALRGLHAPSVLRQRGLPYPVSSFQRLVLISKVGPLVRCRHNIRAASITSVRG